MFRLLACLLFVWAVQSNISPKQLAGPPSEFDLHSLPNPTEGHLTSEYDSHFVYFKKDAGNPAMMSWTGDLYVDSATNFNFLLAIPAAKHLTVKLVRLQTGAEVPLPTPLEEFFPLADNENAKIPISSYRFGSSLPVGAYNLTLTGKASNIQPLQNPFEADGFILSHNDSPYRIYSTLTSYNLKKGQSIGIKSRLYNNLVSSPLPGVAPTAILFEKMTAKLEFELPNGTDISIDMHDDGLHDDEGANDGVFTGTMPAPASGSYLAEPKLIATTASGVTFRRSSLHLFQVVDVPFSLTGSASGIVNNQRLEIFLETGEGTDHGRSYRPYAQVWGKNNKGDDVPVAWISTVSPVVEKGGKRGLQLELDLKWVKMANAFEPLTLRELYVQELNDHIPLVSGLEMTIKTKKDVENAVAEVVVTRITKEMRQGVTPAWLKERQLRRASNSSAETGKLVLLHGYCSDRNPFQQSPNDFTNAAYFVNPKASISNDEFAKKVVEFTKNFESFSLVGHSQGGLASTHLHNYYFTGLEAATNGRLVQSLGSPYQGASIAGSAAALGKIFGVGCGSNDDLTKDGSALWLTGITTETRKDVYYYTTIYPSTGDKYCVWGLNLLLSTPNDGTSELKLTPLVGGNDMGTVSGWCHTEGMKYTAQYYDHTRNQEINSKAAR